MRLCLVKESGRIIEMQEFATAGTLLKNARVSHPEFSPEQLEERDVALAEYAPLRDGQPKSEHEKQVALEVMRKAARDSLLDKLLEQEVKNAGAAPAVKAYAAALKVVS